jgi:hypothetical protein
MVKTKGKTAKKGLRRNKYNVKSTKSSWNQEMQLENNRQEL